MRGAATLYILGVAAGTTARTEPMQSVQDKSPPACAGILAALLLTGCAHAYVDPATGERHVIGLVHLTFPASPSAAETLRTRSVGLLLTHDFATALSVGFTETSLTLVRPDSCAAVTYAPARVRAPESIP